MFLTDAQIAELTGFIRPRKQIEWLQREGFEFRVAADGHPQGAADRLKGQTNACSQQS